MKKIFTISKLQKRRKSLKVRSFKLSNLSKKRQWSSRASLKRNQLGVQGYWRLKYGSSKLQNLKRSTEEITKQEMPMAKWVSPKLRDDSLLSLDQLLIKVNWVQLAIVQWMQSLKCVVLDQEARSLHILRLVSPSWNRIDLQLQKKLRHLKGHSLANRANRSWTSECSRTLLSSM